MSAALQLTIEQIQAMQQLMAEWVKPSVMATITGLTKRAMDRKRETGRWPKGLVWDKVEGEVLYSIAGYNKWVNQNRSCRLVCAPEETTSRSTSSGTESDTSSNGPTRRPRRTLPPQPVFVLR